MALNGPIEDMMKQAIKQNHTQRVFPENWNLNGFMVIHTITFI